MRNPKLVPYETIVRATSGEPEAVDEVLQHYGKRIRLASLENGHVNKDTEDNIKRRLIVALFQFRFIVELLMEIKCGNNMDTG